MDIVRSENGGFVIIHAGRVIDKAFRTEDEAWSWADEFIDDQFFDSPNDFSPPLVYRNGEA
jgi:hypothetical protein